MTDQALYVFNPDHDLALASGDVNYMSPASARRMAEELAVLPMWYAAEKSFVLAPSAYNLAFMREMQARFHLPAALMTEPEVGETAGLLPRPWGWNPALRKRLSIVGIAEHALPSVEQMHEFRRLSHRKQAVELLSRLQLSAFFCGESFYLTDADACRHMVEERPTCLLKAPLSGSGKGLNWCKGAFTTFISGWCSRVIASQGGVVAEPVYDKVVDFAMEFRSEVGGKVSFIGYSLFSTNKSGAYEGNLLLPDAEVESRLSSFVPVGQLAALRLRLVEELSARFGKAYSGYLGVDMMICHFPFAAPEYRIHPCVEINLRMNMGIVAHSLTRTLLAPGSAGRFMITYHPAVGEAYQVNERMKTEHPICLETNKVVSGYVPLAPVTRRSAYRAWVLVDESPSLRSSSVDGVDPHFSTFG